MIVVKTEGSVPIKAWVGRAGSTIINGELKILPDIEDSAMSQLENTAKLPFIHKNGLAVMPDVHGGIGSTVGSVIATKGAIIVSHQIPEPLWNSFSGYMTYVAKNQSLL